MGRAVSSSLKLLSLSWVLNAVVTLPTLGEIDRNRLETYEESSAEPEDLDLFGNLTFRFSCENRPIGLYADTDYNCRIFHACDESGKGFPVICPNDSLFDQRERICSDEEKVDCEHAQEWYYLNELPYSMEVTEDYKLRTIEDEVPSVLPLMPS
ncbi:hypothetical protein KM043_011607 [Ampulex compressa]|nr:hypothetical protein KM043_011607 [Ampulex compressa]